MLSYKGGHTVGKGTYWDMRNGHRIDIIDQGTLPGGEALSYLKLPAGLLLLAGPFIGLAYVVFLPIIGIAVVAAAAARRIIVGAAGVFGKSISFGWRPMQAYLSGKKKKEKKQADK